ncbi:MAG TPA: hydantoinase B/oxoprolinase family protein [Bdellovibrio sp.]|nr:hydantoinase B/oxoprolinase family protein [Bdellovibrio sp.]
MSYQVELLHSLLLDFLQGESALLTIDGEVLGVRGQHPATYGTLVTAAQTVGKYLKLQEGDIAILNDPYSGGSHLNEMTFVMAISEDLLWVRRQPMHSVIQFGKTVEEEGLRIPPTPLRQNGKINELILSAMQAHPACPSYFGEWIQNQFAEMIQRAHILIEAVELSGFEITADLIKDYLNLSKNLAKQKISENVAGETRVDVMLDSGELLRLKLEVHEGKISIDFSGSSAAKTLHLTESATYGACFYAISRYYGFADFANSGSFAVLQVTKPTGCWLMAKYPASISKGFVYGVAALQTAIELAFSAIHPKREKAWSCYSPLIVQMQKTAASSSLMTMRLPGGTGASIDHNGVCGKIENISIEKIEREFPVKITSIQQRSLGENSNKFRGGQGLEIALEAYEDLEVSWFSELTMHKPRQTKNCTYGEPGALSLSSQGTEKKLSALGKQKILRGDVLTLCSGNGGGFGKSE